MRRYNCIKDFSLKILKITSARIHAARWNKLKTIFFYYVCANYLNVFKVSLTAAPAHFICLNSFFLFSMVTQTAKRKERTCASEIICWWFTRTEQ